MRTQKQKWSRESERKRERERKRESDRVKRDQKHPLLCPRLLFVGLVFCFSAGGGCQFIFRRSFFCLPERLCAEQRHTGCTARGQTCPWDTSNRSLFFIPVNDRAEEEAPLLSDPQITRDTDRILQYLCCKQTTVVMMYQIITLYSFCTPED